MSNNNTDTERTIGLFGAIGIGVGAIVGGGILALAGVAFSASGPGAVAAFALNGVIAFLTVLSFAELSALFPQSGGTYTFAKKVLTVETAFAVGWVVWFASIVAAVLYALGFASFFCAGAATLYASIWGPPPTWMTAAVTHNTLAIAACCFYTLGSIRSNQGGGKWSNIVKVVVFGVLIVGGFMAIHPLNHAAVAEKFSPFLPMGFRGLISAMGYSFIALQGFDLIAAVAGEIKQPQRNIPRAMLISLSTALCIYIPLLIVVTLVGSDPGESIIQLSAKNPETIIARAAGHYLGVPGYWLVLTAGVMSMLSALQANLFAASRVAQTMARDRTLFHSLEGISKRYATPVNAIVVTSAIVIAILVALPDVAAAGAAASLIFLVTFALAHMIVYLARIRSGNKRAEFRMPFFPLIPIAGGLACLSLAVFQGVNVPSAGMIAGVWLLSGAVLFLSRFARRARIVDAAEEARDPNLLLYRGRAPLVLVPIANPASAEGLVALATALSPNGIGHVLLLSVVSAPEKWVPGEVPRQLKDAQSVLRESLIAAFSNGLAPEALTTISKDPFLEISRVARDHRCAAVLLGFSKVDEQIQGGNLERLLNLIDSDIVILRAPPGWTMHSVTQILVPVAGKGSHDALRSRLLSSLNRSGPESCKIAFLKILPEQLSAEEVQRERAALEILARDEVPSIPIIRIRQSSQIVPTIARHAKESDLLVLGVQRFGRHRKLFGQIAFEILQQTDCPAILISRRG
jgi:basic amino acid/polyamine antiporter, APA family